VTGAGSCIAASAFAAIPQDTIDGVAACVPPFTVTISGNTLLACATSQCTPAVPGCPTVLHAASGSFGTAPAWQYAIDTPLTADTIVAPLHISGFLGDVDCSATASNLSATLEVDYAFASDPADRPFVYSLLDANAGALNASVSSSGCGAYGYLIALGAGYYGSQLISTIETQFHNEIRKYWPDGAGSTEAGAPGVDATLCAGP
jgi:hypothetical protein